MILICNDRSFENDNRLESGAERTPVLAEAGMGEVVMDTFSRISLLTF